MKSFSRILCNVLVVFLPALSIAQPAKTIDLLDIDPAATPGFYKVFGAEGDGQYGVPMTGGEDMDGDGNKDIAIGYFTVPFGGVQEAGKAVVVLGKGPIIGSVDLAAQTDSFVSFSGFQQIENLGSEIWMRDVTGDGLGDLLICRQNYTPETNRLAAGALTIIPGNANFRTLADERAVLNMNSSDERLPRMDIIGANASDRLGIWVRVGDVDGDGINDVLLGADQNDTRGSNAGEVWVIRGGSHLNPTSSVETLDLATRSTSRLNGQIARILPPQQVGATRAHFGATLYCADMDDNGRAEVLVAATLNRSGASRRPPGTSTTTHQSSGGIANGTLFIAWDDNFPTTLPWPDDFTIDLAAPTGTVTSINGDGPGGIIATNKHTSFGEEIAAGYDFDNDGKSDLFVGDLVGDASPGRTRSASGTGLIFYDAAQLKGLTIDLDTPSTIPTGLRTTEFIGPVSGAIGSDTIGVGDFNGDGIDDLALGNPHDNPIGQGEAITRFVAGTIHVFFGKTGGWPAVIDTAVGQLPTPEQVQITLIQGAKGQSGSDAGDTLCYSGDYADMDGDGKTDFLTNEMIGNGILPEDVDVGNMLILSGTLLDPAPVVLTEKPLWFVY